MKANRKGVTACHPELQPSFFGLQPWVRFSHFDEPNDTVKPGRFEITATRVQDPELRLIQIALEST
jgi:hypothetical protein